jgi:signal transduction histidine kinase
MLDCVGDLHSMRHAFCSNWRCKAFSARWLLAYVGLLSNCFMIHVSLARVAGFELLPFDFGAARNDTGMDGTRRDLLAATLDPERLRNARKLLTLRAALTLAFLALSAVLALVGDVRGARARLPILAVYCAVSLALYAASLWRPEICRHSWMAIALLDIPVVFLFQRAAMRMVPDHAALVAAMTVAIYLLLVMAAQLAIRRSYLMVTAIAGYALLLVLFAAVPNVPWTVWLDALLLAAGAAIVGSYLSTRHIALLEKVTEEHQQVLTLNEGLEQKVAERTVQLESTVRELRAAQAQVVHAEKMASIGRLAAGIAHEINNPINFIANSLAPLETTFADVRAVLALHASGDHGEAAKQMELRGLHATTAEVDDVLRTLRNGVQRSREIVAGLTTFARRDEGEPFREEDISRLLDSAVGLLRYELDSRIEVVRCYCPEGRLRCYPGALVQLFVNLLSNAAQAIDGRGTITLTTAREPRSLTVSVEDTGSGIAPDALPKIFEPFFTTREVGRGTGLGLSIAHGIVERHRGSIRVESRPLAGTRFDVMLPLQVD